MAHSRARWLKRPYGCPHDLSQESSFLVELDQRAYRFTPWTHATAYCTSSNHVKTGAVDLPFYSLMPEWSILMTALAHPNSKLSVTSAKGTYRVNGPAVYQITPDVEARPSEWCNASAWVDSPSVGHHARNVILACGGVHGGMSTRLSYLVRRINTYHFKDISSSRDDDQTPFARAK